MTAIEIIRKIAKSEASKLWKESFEPKLSLIIGHPTFNPMVISEFCEQHSITLTEQNILFI